MRVCIYLTLFSFPIFSTQVPLIQTEANYKVRTVQNQLLGAYTYSLFLNKIIVLHNMKCERNFSPKSAPSIIIFL